ncbi:MAG: helix-turn-helix domain-containing protein [Butyricicoccus sp.]|nr:helix-turn-helix domain-containing protein [Butyricicoccus sp.]
MTTGEKIRARRKQLGMTVDELASKLGKNRATIYRYESDAIEMPANLLKPLSDALDMLPDDLMDWGELLANEAERQDKICELLPLISDGISLEGKAQKYVLLKMPAYDGVLEPDLCAALLTLYQLNQTKQAAKIRTMRILGELVSSLDSKSQEKLVSYGEFLDTQNQRKRGISMEHPYQRE